MRRAAEVRRVSRGGEEGEPGEGEAEAEASQGGGKERREGVSHLVRMQMDGRLGKPWRT